MAGTDPHPISSFIDRHFLHFNAAALKDATDAYIRHIDGGGVMFMTIAGAMSTAELGISLAEMIRRDKVHAITCTGANLEEDIFNLVAHSHYRRIPHYRDLTPADEQKLLDQHLNRVTDTCIPEEEAMRRIERLLIDDWIASDQKGERYFPHEFMYRLIRSGKLKQHYEIDPANSWLLAACEKNLPVFVPGWEDSTLGNVFAARCMEGKIKSPQTVKGGIETMMCLAAWYRDTAPTHASRLLPDRRRHCRRLPDLRRADDPSGSEARRRAALGLLLPDQRFDDELRLVLGRGAEREDHVGKTRRDDAQVHRRVRRDDLRAAHVRENSGLVVPREYA